MKNIEAFLSAEYSNFLGYAKVLVRDHRLRDIQAEDLLNETLTRLYQKYPEKILHKGYVFRSLANAASDQLRKEIRARLKAESGEHGESVILYALGGDAEQRAEDAQNNLTFSEKERLLHEALGKCLDEHQANDKIRELLNIDTPTFFLNKKPAELGKLLGINPRTVSNYLLWIRKKLYPCVRGKLQNRGNHGEVETP